MSTWTMPADAVTKREPTDAESAATEDVLSVSDAWAANEIPTGEALALVLAEPRAIGTAFRFAWHDPRRPALEALHRIEYEQHEDDHGNRGWVYTNFGWLQRSAFEMTERNNAWRRTQGMDDWSNAA